MNCPGIAFTICNLRWENRDYSGALPNNFAAEFTIEVEGAVWYSESYESAGELLVSLRDWLNAGPDAKVAGWVFHSSDTENNPVLQLTPGHDRSIWWLRQFADKAPRVAVTSAAVEPLIRKLHDLLTGEIVQAFGSVDIRW